MSFVTVFCWPPYLRIGDRGSVLRLVLVYGNNKAVYRRDAGDWTLTVQHDDRGIITTAFNEYTVGDERRTLAVEGELMTEATWDEHKADNGNYALKLTCSQIRPTD